MAKTKTKTETKLPEGNLVLMFLQLGSWRDGAPPSLIEGEIAQWEKIEGDMAPECRELCHRSHVFRDWARQGAVGCEAEGCEEKSEVGRAIRHTCQGRLHDLTRLWEIAGKPEGKSPAEFGDGGIDGAVVEDRGDEGVWGDYEVSAWYCQHLDDRLEPPDICSVLY